MPGFTNRVVHWAGMLLEQNSMKKVNIFTRVLAILGTVLAWFPIFMPVSFSILRLAQTGSFHYDFLMPAEFFLVAFSGGILLWWSAHRAAVRHGLITWGLGVAVFSVVAGQLLAVFSGLASGETEPTGLAWMLVLTSLAIYTLALVVTGLGGVLLLRTLFRRAPNKPLPAG